MSRPPNAIVRLVAASSSVVLLVAACNKEREPTGRAAQGSVSAAVEQAAPASDGCRACVQARCAEQLVACEGAAGAAPALGPQSVDCKAVLGCARETRCASLTTPEACYCGEGVEIDACLAGTVRGACKAVIETGAGTTNPAEVGARFQDPQYATGRAFRLLRCEGVKCRRECYGP